MKKQRFETVNRKKRKMDANAPLDISGPLAFDRSFMDDDKEYYIAKNDATTLAKMDSKDWDIVREASGIKTGDGNEESIGSVVEFDNGAGGKMVLMSKPKKWCDEDRARKMKALEATEEAMKTKNEEDFIKKE